MMHLLVAWHPHQHFYALRNWVRIRSSFWSGAVLVRTLKGKAQSRTRREGVIVTQYCPETTDDDMRHSGGLAQARSGKDL